MDIQDTMLSLLRARAPGASICPSDVARALAAEEAAWRPLMAPVRDAAAQLAQAGVVIITQGDQTVDPADVHHGAIRLRRGPAFR
jgi:hypothetical protein